MKHFAIIGNPVGQSLSPTLHNWVFHRLGLDAEYTQIQLTGGGLTSIVNKLRYGELNGFNVTHPFKQEIVPFLDEVNAQAQRINAVNCVARERGRIVGHNTDWYGFAKTVHLNGIELGGTQVVLLGAGGAAHSVLFALLRKGAKTVFIVNRTLEKARSLVALMANIDGNTVLRVARPGELEDVLSPGTIIINCTPVGMWPNIVETPFPAHLVRRGMILMDLVYNPLQTQFLRLGKRAGATTVGGLDMLIHQGLRSLDLWFNNTLSQDVNPAELKAFLEEKLAEVLAK